MLDHLSPSIEQLKLKSKSILTDWQEYNRVLLQMDKILREAEAEIDRVETSAINVETYEMTTRKAQVRIRGRNGEDFLLPASPRPEKSSPRFAPPCFLKVFLLTALTPKTETERIFYSPLRFAPKKVFRASPRPDSPPRFGLW
jgi:hypothetical protein